MDSRSFIIESERERLHESDANRRAVFDVGPASTFPQRLHGRIVQAGKSAALDEGDVADSSRCIDHESDRRRARFAASFRQFGIRWFGDTTVSVIDRFGRGKGDRVAWDRRSRGRRIRRGRVGPQRGLVGACGCLGSCLRRLIGRRRNAADRCRMRCGGDGARSGGGYRLFRQRALRDGARWSWHALWWRMRRRCQPRRARRRFGLRTQQAGHDCVRPKLSRSLVIMRRDEGSNQRRVDERYTDESGDDTRMRHARGVAGSLPVATGDEAQMVSRTQPAPAGCSCILHAADVGRCRYCRCPFSSGKPATKYKVSQRNL